MKFNYGLYKDGHPSAAPQGSWRNAKNVMINRDGSVNRDISQVIMDDLQETGMLIIGIIETPEEAILFMTDNTISEIGRFDGSNYTRIVRDIAGSRMDFNNSNPIEGVYRKNYNGELIIMWTDNLNQARILNVDNLPFEIDGTETYSDSLASRINIINLFPETIITKPFKRYPAADYAESVLYYDFENTAQKTLNENINNQYILNIVYRFKIDENTYTAWQHIDNQFSISSNEAASIGLSLIDIGDDYFYISAQIALIYQDGGVTTAKYWGELNEYNGGFETLTVLGDYNSYETYDLNELLIDPITFLTCKTVADLKDKIYLGNLEYNENIDYQKYANNINVNWIYKTVAAQVIENSGYGNSTAASNSGPYTNTPHAESFIPGEVYALYIHFIFKDGTRSVAYHIPGREALTNDTQAATVANGYTQGEENVGDSINGDVKKFHVRDTGAFASSVMSYWENEEEEYPATTDFVVWEEDPGNLGSGHVKPGADFRGDNVRHHKIPEYETLYNSVTGSRMNLSIGISVNNIFVPDELEEKVSGFVISYAKPNINNRTVLGQCYFQPHNYVKTSSVASDPDFVRLHDDTLLTKKPELPNIYLKRQYRHDNGDGAYIVAVNTPAAYYEGLAGVVETVADYAYVPRDISITDYYDNTGREECLVVRTTTALGLGSYTDDGNAVNDQFVFGTICAYRANVYQPFTEQQLVSTNSVAITNGSNTYATTTYSGGGLKINNTYAIGKELQDQVAPEGYLVREFNYQPFQLLRTDFEVLNSDITTINTLADATDLKFNRWNYTTLYSVFNTLKQPLIYNTRTTYINSFPNRILESIIAQTEEKGTSGWRTFLATSYQEIGKEKGSITKLQAFNKSLIILCEYATYLAKIKDILNTDNLTAYLGRGDVFDREPDELIPDTIGKVGSKHQFGTEVCERGFIFIDTNEKRVYLIADGIQDITGNIFDFFKNATANIDDDIPTEPLASSNYRKSMMIKYDRNIDTLYVSVRFRFDGGSIDNYVTLSYSFRLPQPNWVATHDFTPMWYFKTKDYMFSIQDDQAEGLIFYKHNDTTLESFGMTYVEPGTLVYPEIINSADQQTLKCFIEPIFNFGENVLVKSVTWKSRYIESTNQILNPQITITDVLLYNDLQFTGEIQLYDPITPLNLRTTARRNDQSHHRYATGTYRNNEGIWSFNGFRDEVIKHIYTAGTIVYENDAIKFVDDEGNIDTTWLDRLGASFTKPYYDRGRFTGNFVIVRLEFKIDDDLIVLYDVNVNAIKSHRNG